MTDACKVKNGRPSKAGLPYNGSSQNPSRKNGRHLIGRELKMIDSQQGYLVAAAGLCQIKDSPPQGLSDERVLCPIATARCRASLEYTLWHNV